MTQGKSIHYKPTTCHLPTDPPTTLHIKVTLCIKVLENFGNHLFPE